jgi:hypothetical protein
MANESRELISYAKKIVHNKTLKKIRKIKDDKDRINSLRYIIKSELEMMHYDLIRKLRKKESEKKDIFSLEVKIGLLNTKIRYFNITYNKKDFKNIMTLYKEIKNEMKDV